MPSCQRIFARSPLRSPENVQIAAMRVALQLLLDLKRQPLHPATQHVGVPPRSTPAPCSASIIVRSEHLKTRRSASAFTALSTRTRAPRAKLDFDHPGFRSSAACCCARLFGAQPRASPLQSQPEAKSSRLSRPVQSSRLPSPCEEQALRNAVSPRHLTHHGSRHQRSSTIRAFFIPVPTPSAFDPENLPIHLRVTLKLASTVTLKRPPHSKAAAAGRIRITVSKSVGR